MYVNHRIWQGMLLLALFGLSPLADARDLSTLQTALRVAQDELKTVEEQRDADAQFVAKTEMELEMLKKKLEAARSKAAWSDKRYLEAKQHYDKAQADIDRAWQQ